MYVSLGNHQAKYPSSRCRRTCVASSLSRSPRANTWRASLPVNAPLARAPAYIAQFQQLSARPADMAAIGGGSCGVPEWGFRSKPKRYRTCKIVMPAQNVAFPPRKPGDLTRGRPAGRSSLWHMAATRPPWRARKTFRERGSAPKRGGHSTILFPTKCIFAVAAWWFDNPHQKAVPRRRIPRSTSHFS